MMTYKSSFGSNNFKRQTKAFEDLIAKGGLGLNLLTISEFFPIEGGERIFVNEKIIGAIGVSGMQSSQDEKVG